MEYLPHQSTGARCLPSTVQHLFEVSSEGFWNLPEKNKEDPLLKAPLFTFASPRYLYSGSPPGGHLATRAVLSSVIRLASAQVWLGFIHPPGVGILKLISKNALEPVWNLHFLVMCVSPPKNKIWISHQHVGHLGSRYSHGFPPPTPFLVFM